MKPQLNITAREFLADLLFTCFAAFATGAAIGGIAFLVIRLAVPGN